MPLGAFGGRRDIMDKLAPLGPVYQAGTLSGNPVAVAAGLATLKLVQAPGFFDRLAATTRQLVDGLVTARQQQRHAVLRRQRRRHVRRLLPATCPGPAYAEVMRAARSAFNRFFHAMLDRGVYLAPSAFEAGFVSAAHGEADIDATVKAAA